MSPFIRDGSRSRVDFSRRKLEFKGASIVEARVGTLGHVLYPSLAGRRARFFLTLRAPFRIPTLLPLSACPLCLSRFRPRLLCPPPAFPQRVACPRLIQASLTESTGPVWHVVATRGGADWGFSVAFEEGQLLDFKVVRRDIQS